MAATDPLGSLTNPRSSPVKLSSLMPIHYKKKVCEHHYLWAVRTRRKAKQVFFPGSCRQPGGPSLPLAYETGKSIIAIKSYPLKCTQRYI